jgi:chromosome transmission fidelity protein 8
MPIAKIDYTKAHERLKNDIGMSISKIGNNIDNVISSPFGLVMVEIQGELNLPTHIPRELNENYIKLDDINYAIKLGNLEIDEVDHTKITLYTGNFQRLLGTLEKLKTPLGVLKIPIDHSPTDENQTSKTIEMIDIVDKKLIFKERPLPIM